LGTNFNGIERAQLASPDIIRSFPSTTSSTASSKRILQMEDTTVQIEFIGARIKTALPKSIAIHRMQMANDRLARRSIPAPILRGAFKTLKMKIGPTAPSSDRMMAHRHLFVRALAVRQFGVPASLQVVRGRRRSVATS
jgi:hypothetical protein